MVVFPLSSVFEVNLKVFVVNAPVVRSSISESRKKYNEKM